MIKGISWKLAVRLMYFNSKIRVRRKHWLACDYLYMKNGVLYDDGGNRFLERLGSTAGKWYIYQA